VIGDPDDRVQDTSVSGPDSQARELAQGRPGDSGDPGGARRRACPAGSPRRGDSAFRSPSRPATHTILPRQDPQVVGRDLSHPRPTHSAVSAV
jgi:hypothetical protein